MSVKQAVRKQYQTLVDAAVPNGLALTRPPEGWLRTVRTAMGMSGAQLARRMGVTRARISNAEHAERDGGITLKSMEAAAEAMGCRFVYAIVPDTTVDGLVANQARKKAQRLVRTASGHMALESQGLPANKIKQEIDRIARDLVREMPSDLWDDK